LCVEYLKEQGAALDAVDYAGQTLLHYAARGSIECLKYVMRITTDYSTRDNDGATALHSAASANDPQLITELLFHSNNQLKIDDIDDSGATPCEQKTSCCSSSDML
jgi:ankyrin repeat protein